MSIKFIGLSVVGLMALLFACNYDPRAGLKEETPTRGNIRISVDESFFLISEAELYTFQSIYTNAIITPQYKPELEVWSDFLGDSIRTIITSRKLSQKETDYFKSKNIYPTTVKIAYDGIAFIVNKKNKDSLIQYLTIRNIFYGTVTSWNQISRANSAGNIKVVFDNNKSSAVRYIREKFNITASLPANCYAVNKNEDVIKYVEKNVNAIGVIGVNWISDKDDSITRGFMKKIRVVGVSSEFAPDSPDYFKPYQGFIADKSYPFIREIYMINRESFAGLGSGLLQFITADQGQRIVLKMGMVPATMPIRLIKIRSTF